MRRSLLFVAIAVLAVVVLLTVAKSPEVATEVSSTPAVPAVEAPAGGEVPAAEAPASETPAAPATEAPAAPATEAPAAPATEAPAGLAPEVTPSPEQKQ